MVETHEEFVRRMFRFSTGETRCGPGSTLEYTKELRKQLPLLIKKYNIRRLVDAGCGDFNWINHVKLGCEYYPFDLHGSPSVDISKDQLPDCDLILCRDVMIHMPIQMIKDTLKLFSESSPLMLATSYDTDFSNEDTQVEARRLNLEHPPFNKVLIDKLEEADPGKFLGLWETG